MCAVEGQTLRSVRVLEGRLYAADSAKGPWLSLPLPAVRAGAACAPGSTSGAPVLGSLCLAAGESIFWRLLISLEPGLGSVLPKLNSSSAPPDVVFGVLGCGSES